MFKLVVLSVLVALATARPGHLLAPTVYSSAVVGSVPTSISSHSISQVHASPVVHTYHAAPVAVAHAAPLAVAHAAPLAVAHAAPLAVAHAPIAVAHAHPVAHSIW